MNGNRTSSSLMHEAHGERSMGEADLVHDVGEELLDRAREISESIVKRVRQLTEAEPTNGQSATGS